MAAAQFSSNNPSTASKHSALTFDLHTSSVTMGEKKGPKTKTEKFQHVLAKAVHKKLQPGLL